MIKRFFPAVVLIAVIAAVTNAQTVPVSQKRLVWELGSMLSLAGVIFAESTDKALIARQFARASAAAAAMNIKLPDLPAKTGKAAQDSAAGLNYLLNVTGKPIGTAVQQKFGTEHAAIFEIALKSNILLMLYGPGYPEAKTVVEVIKARTVKANLPAAMTQKLLDLIERGASYEEVKKEIFEVHRFAPEFIAVLEQTQTGELAYTNKDYAGSAAAYSNAIALNPTGPEHYFLRARAYMQLRNTDAAIADYTKVIELQTASASVKNLPVVYHHRGLAYSIATQYPLAIADLNMAIKLRPEYASAYKVRSIVHKNMGNKKMADEDMATAEKLQPGIK